MYPQMPAKTPPKDRTKREKAPAKTPSELEAESLFRGFKRALIARFGRGPLDSEQIDTFGLAAFGEKWGGAMGQDAVPTPLPRDKYYVVNTSRTPDSGGVHWMGLRVTASGAPYVYDSFARSSAALLHEMNGSRKKGAGKLVDSDRRDAEQRGGSAVCGHLSLAWLLVARDLGIRTAMLI